MLKSMVSTSQLNCLNIDKARILVAAYPEVRQSLLIGLDTFKSANLVLSFSGRSSGCTQVTAYFVHDMLLVTPCIELYEDERSRLSAPIQPFRSEAFLF